MRSESVELAWDEYIGERGETRARSKAYTPPTEGPCATCALAERCATERLACSAFVTFTHNGKLRSPTQPSRAIYERLFGNADDDELEDEPRPRKRRGPQNPKGWVRTKDGFSARISHEGRAYNLGTQHSAEEAHEAYQEARRRIADGLDPRPKFRMLGAADLTSDQVQQRLERLLHPRPKAATTNPVGTPGISQMRSSMSVPGSPRTWLISAADELPTTQREERAVETRPRAPYAPYGSKKAAVARSRDGRFCVLVAGRFVGEYETEVEAVEVWHREYEAACAAISPDFEVRVDHRLVGRFSTRQAAAEAYWLARGEQ